MPLQDLAVGIPFPQLVFRLLDVIRLDDDVPDDAAGFRLDLEQELLVVTSQCG
jgi:hypothetical protein